MYVCVCVFASELGSKRVKEREKEREERKHAN